MFSDVDTAYIAVPMDRCTDSFQVRDVVASQLPVQAGDLSYVCIQLCKHSPDF